MTVAQDLIERTRRHLFSGQEEESNRIAAPVAASDLSIPFKYGLGGLVRGAVFSVGIEEIRVWETDANMTATVVERGVNGTTAASHVALDFVVVRPKFSNFRIFTELNSELADLGSPMNAMFSVATVDLTFNSAIRGYDMTGATDVIRILEARFKVPGPSKNYPLITRYSLQRKMGTTDFASGFVFDTYETAYPGLPIRVRYAAPYGQLMATTDDVQVVTGLSASANDIPPMGAAVRLVAPRELKRNFSEAQYDPRRGEEVPAGAVAKSVVGLAQLRAQRIRAEATRLMSDWPIMVSR